MALIALYVEDKKFHTYDGTTAAVIDLNADADLKALISADTTYGELHTWAEDKADDILAGKTELAVYSSNFDTSVEDVADADFKGYIDFHSDVLISMIFGVINARVAAGTVRAYVGRLDGIRHFCQADGTQSVRPRIESLVGFTGRMHLTGCSHTPQAAIHLPYTLYKHFTTPY